MRKVSAREVYAMMLCLSNWPDKFTVIYRPTQSLVFDIQPELKLPNRRNDYGLYFDAAYNESIIVNGNEQCLSLIDKDGTLEAMAHDNSE